MDDILVLAPTCWKLRRAVAIVNETLAGLGLEKHPEKIFIGRAAKGFEFLGYRLSLEGFAMAKTTLQRSAGESSDRPPLARRELDDRPHSSENTARPHTEKVRSEDFGSDRKPVRTKLARGHCPGRCAEAKP